MTGWEKFLGVVMIIGVIAAMLSLLRDSTEWTVDELNADAKITVNTPTDNQVSSCEVITGTVEPKDDAELWVAHIKRGDSQYFYRKAERAQDGKKWFARIGFGGNATEDAIFDVYVFYLPLDYSQFLTSLKGQANDGGPGFVYSNSLPPGVNGDPLISPARRAGMGLHC